MSSPIAFTLRPAELRDVAPIVALIRELAEFEKLTHLLQVTPEKLRPHLFGEKPVAEALVGELPAEGLAEGESPIVAFALFFTNFSTFLAQPGLYLEDLYVKPSHRGGGIGEAMLELQSRLSTQVTPVTPAQRDAIREHAQGSVAILQAAGITDREWLDAVAHHHEVPTGAGYPQQLAEVGELASMLRRADVFTAKLSPRVTRAALAANQAARQMFLQDQGHPMSAALVKEFGVYPPGCCVKLASGEVGLVVKRGDTATTPIVAALTNRKGEPMIDPVRRNSALAEHTIVEVVDEKSLRVRVSPEKLVVLANG